MRKIPTRRYFVGRGLSRAVALLRAVDRDWPRDHRGFGYNARTGWATLT
jgi:hypothetical protein